MWLLAVLLWGGSTLLACLAIKDAQERDTLFILGGMVAAYCLLGFIMQLASIKARDTFLALLDVYRERGCSGAFAQLRAFIRQTDYLAPDGFSKRVNVSSFIMSYAGPLLAVPAYSLATIVFAARQLLR